MSKFFTELKRRNVIKAAIAYLVIAWVLLQVASLVLPIVNAPEWVLKTFIFFLILLFPVWLFISWVYEVTPDGLKKSSLIPEDSSIADATNKRLNVLILIVLPIAIAVAFINKPSVSNTDNISASANLEKSIAVLPFDDMSSEGDTEWFCDGVTEDILTNLSIFKDLKVISRTSTERYKNSDKSIPEIARELGVSYLLEGSVRKHENKIIITAQLIDANDNHIWAEKYNKDFTEVFKIQQDVSKKIVDELRIAMSPQEERTLATSPTDNLEAYQLVLKARYNSLNTDSEGYPSKSIELLERAIELDNSYADAYAELAYAQLMMFFTNNRDEKYIRESRKNIEKALLLNPNTSRAYTTLAIIHDEINKGWDESSRDYERALEINPNDALAHFEYGLHYGYRPEPNNTEYLKHIKRAQELNPLSNIINVELVKAYAKNDSFLQAKKHLGKIENQISEIERIGLSRDILLLQNKNYLHHIDFYNNLLETTSERAYVLKQIGDFYDGIMNDDIMSEKYLSEAYAEDSTEVAIARGYNNILLEQHKFKQALVLSESPNFQKILTREQKILSKFYYYYHQKQYVKAKQVTADSSMDNRIAEKVILHAQMKNFPELNNLLYKNNLPNTQKAFAYAILKNRDSMYHYLNKRDVNFQLVNSRMEFNPYRKEPEYLEFMKKNNLPIIEKYNGKGDPL